MGKYFGTDGFRGKAGEGLTAEHAYKIGRFLGWYYSRSHRAQTEKAGRPDSAPAAGGNSQNLFITDNDK